MFLGNDDVSLSLGDVYAAWKGPKMLNGAFKKASIGYKAKINFFSKKNSKEAFFRIVHVMDFIVLLEFTRSQLRDVPNGLCSRFLPKSYAATARTREGVGGGILVGHWLFLG